MASIYSTPEDLVIRIRETRRMRAFLDEHEAELIYLWDKVREVPNSVIDDKGNVIVMDQKKKKETWYQINKPGRVGDRNAYRKRILDKVRRGGA